MKASWGVILLIVGLSLTGLGQEASLDDQGEAAIHAGRVGDALAIFSKAIEVNPADARAFCGRAYTYTLTRDYAKGLLDCREAITLSPHFAKAYCVMGNINWIQGRLEDAGNDFDEALSLDPKDPEIWYNRGLYYLHKDNYKCITDMTEALRIDPNYKDAYYIRGNAYFEQQKYDVAIQDYTDGIRLNPTYGNLYHQRGFAYQKSGQLDKAIADFGRAIEVKPQSDNEYYARGYTYCEEHDYVKAIADFTEAIAINPKNDGYYDQRALAYQQEGEKDKADEDFKQAGLLKGQRGN